MGNLFTPAGASPLALAASKILAEQLAHVPADTLQADIIVRDDETGRTILATVATRIDHENWALGIGGFFQKDEDGDRTAGAGVTVSWR